MGNLENEMDSFKRTIQLLDQCIDDYLYILDIKKDKYYISPHATIRFNMESNEFDDPVEGFKKFVYEHDYDGVMNDLRLLMSGKKSFHNMQYRWLDKAGIPVWINCRGQALYDENRQACYLIGCINEIGKRQAADNNSGLLGEMSLKKFIFPIQQDIQTGFLLRLGIDDFKSINENNGLKYGDHILKETAKCIKNQLSILQNIYKIGSDEFIILDFLGNKEDAKMLYHKIQDCLLEYIESINYEVYFTLSAGIIDFKTNPTAHYNEMMKWSEYALSLSKKRGKNTYTLYQKDSYEKFQREVQLTKILRQAVINYFSGFEVHFQPIISVETKKMQAMEALLRFECQEYGKVSPGEFIPILEKSDLIIPVGRWVLRKSLEAVTLLQEKIPQLKVHVNISYIQVLKANALKDILRIVSHYHLNKEQLVIELTESGFVESDENFIHFCKKLRENNILLALDDFGTGYSNFHYLYNLKPNSIKIDRNLMRNAFVNDYEKMLLSHMIEMAHSVGAQICIEGVENEEEYQKIIQMAPDYIQGYYFSRPCSLEDLQEKIDKKIIG